MSWEKEVLEIEHRKALALAQGGPEAIAVQHSKGRLSIRERIDAVLDAGTFVERRRARSRISVQRIMSLASAR